MPPPPTTLSVCAIARNEESCVNGFLAALEGFATEVIIVDTGSTDETVSKVSMYAQQSLMRVVVIEHPFSMRDFHFGRARNISLKYATSDYILVLDLDEEPTDKFKASFKSFLADYKPSIATILRKDELVQHLIEDTPRLTRKQDCIRYADGDEGLVHEKLLITSTPVHFKEGVVMHKQGKDHFLRRPHHGLQQLVMQIDRVPKTKTFFGHFLRGLWYFWFRFRKLYFGKNLRKDGLNGFKYAFIRGLDAFLIELFVGLKPPDIK